jgi:pyruvate formate lyase activating enzyme
MGVKQTTGLIFDLRKFSVHDGPGIRTTVFFKGCPLSCWWCHNPESQGQQPEIMLWDSRCIGCQACVAVCPQGAIIPNAGAGTAGHTVTTDRERCTRCGDCIPHCPSDAREWIGRTASVGEVMAEINRDVNFFDESGGGVTFSGGEPLMQPGFLLALLQACREQEIHTALDTSGYAAWEILDQVRPFVNLFLVDIKCMDDERHRQVTGVSNMRILSNLRALAEHGHAIILRVPLVPGINDDPANLDALGELASSLPGVERVDLLPYHHAAAGKYDRMQIPYMLPDTLPPAAEMVEALAARLRERGLSVKIGG